MIKKINKQKINKSYIKFKNYFKRIKYVIFEKCPSKDG